MNEQLERSQRLLACLGDRSRFHVVTELLAGDYCVTELAQQVGLSQSCTTRHLQVLEREGLVHRVREGRRVFFRLREGEPGLNELLEWVMTRTHPAAGVPKRRAMESGANIRGDAYIRPSSAAPADSIPMPDAGDAPSSEVRSRRSDTELKPLERDDFRGRADGDLDDFLL